MPPSRRMVTLGASIANVGRERHEQKSSIGIGKVHPAGTSASKNRRWYSFPALQADDVPAG